jgi:enamine deaminase RidA (YjgF/YER057c/UK114 family)
VRAGPFLFVGGCDGHRELGSGRIAPQLAGNAKAQCENAYGRLARSLNEAGSSTSSVVRLDHVTSSQDWLPIRQSVRERIFGKPAPLASTGVAARMSGINMLTAFAIACADAGTKEVLVPGPRYGMANIATAVRGGPLVFLSGIRGLVDPRDGRAVAEETPEAFAAQTRVVYVAIESILADCGLTPHSILRIDSWLRDSARAAEDEAICRELLGPAQYASTRKALPLSARGETEVTVLAAGPGVDKKIYDARGEPTVTSAAGFHFVGECRGIDGPPSAANLTLIANPRAQLSRALGVLDTALRNCGSELSKTVRLELYLRDIYFADAAQAMLRNTFGEECPAVATIGADLESPVEVKLNAIAI